MQEKKFTPPPVLLNTLRILLSFVDEKPVLEQLFKDEIPASVITFLANNKACGFINTGQTGYVTEDNYDDQNYKEKNSTMDVAVFLSPFLSDQKLYQLCFLLTEKETKDNSEAISNIFRGASLAKSFTIQLFLRYQQAVDQRKLDLESALKNIFQLLIKNGQKNYWNQKNFDGHINTLFAPDNMIPEFLKNSTALSKFSLPIELLQIVCFQVISTHQVIEINLEKSAEKSFEILQLSITSQFNLKFMSLCQLKNLNQETFTAFFLPFYPLEERENNAEKLKNMFNPYKKLLIQSQELGNIFQKHCETINSSFLEIDNFSTFSEYLDKELTNSIKQFHQLGEKTLEIFSENDYLLLLQRPGQESAKSAFNFIKNLLLCTPSLHTSTIYFLKNVVNCSIACISKFENKQEQEKSIILLAEKFKTFVSPFIKLLGQASSEQLQREIFGLLNNTCYLRKQNSDIEYLEQKYLQEIFTFIKLDNHFDLKLFWLEKDTSSFNISNEEDEKDPLKLPPKTENKSPPASPRNTNSSQYVSPIITGEKSRIPKPPTPKNDSDDEDLDKKNQKN